MYNVHFSMYVALQCMCMRVHVAAIPAHSVNSYFTREKGVDIIGGIGSDRGGPRFV